MRYEFTLDGRSHFINQEEHADGPRFAILGDSFAPIVRRVGRGEYEVTIDDETYQFAIHDGQIMEGSQVLDLEVRRAKPELIRRGGASRRADGKIKPPMPGKVVELKVKEGDSVTEGQVVLVLEAMKMQNDIKSPVAGTVTRINAGAGQNVEQSTVMLEIEPTPTPE